MSFDLSSLRFFFVVAVFWLLIVPFLSKKRNTHRAVIAVFTVVIGLRYLIWRLFQTVLPFSGSSGETAWVVFVYVIEILAFIEICIFLLIMSKYNNRSREADAYQQNLFRFPSVDVFIPTYNEDINVLEKTILGAKHLDYPCFKVWVLDDGRRQWLKEFCENNSVGYFTRPDNAHAKAGNLNNGLRHTNAELFAIFDADFIPASNFLRRTVGFFIHNEDIGIVQTPQHFFNRDPIQSNLYLDKVWPDEQRLFFDAMAPSRDGWNAAFCCGSCSIIRRKAVDMVGGIPTSSITEDLLTTLCLLTVNYRTVYLKEKLSQGMSADSIKGYFIQRSRWCRGGIQCFFVPQGPLRSKGLTILQRILFSPYGWIIQPITRIVMLSVPIIYLWMGISPLHFTSLIDILTYQFPMFLAFALSMQWFARKKYVPFISTSVGIFGMFRLLPVVISSLIKPFGEPFRVTPKGAGMTVGTDWYILVTAASFILITLLGILANLIPEYRILAHMQFFPYAFFWSCLNIFILVICCLICFDTPRKRKEERFIVNEESNFNGQTVLIEDISLGGCKVKFSADKQLVKCGDHVKIHIPDVSGEITAEIKRGSASGFTCVFKEMSSSQKEELIVKLFTGRYDNEIRETKPFTEIISSLLRRAFGNELK